MSKFVLALFFCFATANALKCYSCNGSGCDTDTRLWETVMCGASGVPQYSGYQWACLKQTYKDRVSYKRVVERKCVSVSQRDGKPWYQCRTELGEAEECPVCQTDLCNSGNSVKLGFFAVPCLVLGVVAKNMFFL